MLAKLGDEQVAFQDDLEVLRGQALLGEPLPRLLGSGQAMAVTEAVCCLLQLLIRNGKSSLHGLLKHECLMHGLTKQRDQSLPLVQVSQPIVQRQRNVAKSGYDGFATRTSHGNASIFER